MVSQAKGGCKECGSMSHTAMYHKPRKPLKRTPIKNRVMWIGDPVGLPKKKPKKRTESRSQLVKKMDSIFSQYIRLKDAVDGQATCVTCGNTKGWKLQQNGHYESRGKFPTRWDEHNCHVQCYACNVAMKGNYTSYARYMVNTYGAGKLEELHIKANSGTKISTPELRDLIQQYKEKVKELI